MAFIDCEKPLRACRIWCKWLSTVPLGQTTHQRNTVDSIAREWTVRRTAVEDKASGKITAYLNVLEDEVRSTLSEQAFSEIAGAIADLTLHGSFIQYGSRDCRGTSLDWLEQLASRLEQSLSLSDGRPA